MAMTKRFGSFTAVDDLSLSLFKDEIFCFLGHNGAGKTTSLNVLMGKIRPSQGTVKLAFEGGGGQDRHEATETILDIRDDAQQA
jgi:ABC-type multidrug transport system ATPase subunit